MKTASFGILVVAALFAGCLWAGPVGEPGGVMDPKGEDGGPRYWYYHFEEKIPLNLDTGRLVYKRSGDGGARGADPAAKAAAWEAAKGRPVVELEGFGIEAEDMTPNDQAHSWMIDIKKKKLDADGVEALVKEIAAKDLTAFVAPVFMSDIGPFIMTPMLGAIVHAGVGEDRTREVIAELGIGEVASWERHGLPNYVTVRSSAKNGFELLKDTYRLRQHIDVQGAGPDWFMPIKILFLPTDTEFDEQWGLRNTGQQGGVVDVDIDADEAWDVTKGEGVKVLVLDTGVQDNHPDLNIVPGSGRNFWPMVPVDGGGPVTPQDNHGTAVAGVIAAKINGIGTVGVAPESTVVSAKMINMTNAGASGPLLDNMVAAIQYSLVVGARVTNTSFEIDDDFRFTAAYSNTRNAGVFHVAGAGNTGDTILPDVVYPASLSTVLAVGSFNRNELVPASSNHELKVLDVVAPGVDILTTDRTGPDGFNAGSDYTTQSGTSFAAPHVAGIAALMLSKNPTLTPIEIRNILRSTAPDIPLYGFGITEFTGYGRVNAAAAVGGVPARTDIDHDGAVNATDLSLVLASWGACPAAPEICGADVNGDGVVNLRDLTDVLGAWT